MLVSRPHDSEQNPWAKSKYEDPLHKPSSGSRMSHHYEAPLPSQSDWQGQQYSYLGSAENSLYSQSYEHSQAPHGDAGSQAPRSAADASMAMDIDSKPARTTLSPERTHQHSGDASRLGPPRQLSAATEPENQGELYAQKATESVNEGSVSSADTPAMAMGSNALSSDQRSQAHGEEQVKQEDDDEDLDDEDLDGEAEGITAEMTPAERTAARRKMKRFRLTHQQTRFLMSEFAKQPHPDAIHRERLSREIPGLSPRQVQVWFQNRRAKIKRLTVDDRERMIKMRAVPEGFDNVQALHSPYGAVHGLGPPMNSPVGFAPGGYPDHMMNRSLVVDVRRPEGEDTMSSTGLSPGFGAIGFSTSSSMSSNPDMMTPMSHESSDRYDYAGPLAGPRSSNPFTRQSGLDAPMPMHSHHARQPVRPLQPLQLRETLGRSRPDSMQSPLRTSMSWKGDSIDYTSYQAGGGHSPQPLSGRQASVYQPQEPTTLGGYDSSTYSSTGVTSPTHIGYPAFQSSSFMNSQQNRSRIRAASATFPSGLDLSAQRSYTGAQPPRSATSPTNRHLAVSAAPYTTSFPTAPLTAPSDFNLPRTPSYPTRPQDYTMPQLSAPIAPPHDFSQAFHSMSSNARTPMRDTFLSGERGHNDSPGMPGGELSRKAEPSITVTVTQA